MVNEEPAKDQGIRVTRPETQTAPPLEGLGDEGPGEGMPLREPGPVEKVTKVGAVPLHPAVVRLPVSMGGRILSEITKYPGFTFTDRELDDLAALWEQCGLEIPALVQAAIGSSSMISMKALGYFAWVKAGKPPIHVTSEGEPIIMEPKEE